MWSHTPLYWLDQGGLDCRVYSLSRHHLLHDRSRYLDRSRSGPSLIGYSRGKHQRGSIYGSHQYAQSSSESKTRCGDGAKCTLSALRSQVLHYFHAKEAAKPEEDMVLHFDTSDVLRYPAVYHDQLACQ